MRESNNVVVIGGGAAGMMAAGTAASLGAHVTLLEPNGKLGKKLFITGKGRCNVTNNCAGDEVLKNVPTNPRFLYGALAGFSPADAMAFFEEHGCQLKTERGNRVFPQSDRSFDVSGALDKLDEETAELRQAVRDGTNIEEELGDVLFAAVKVGRFCGVDPETAVNGTCEKFIRRFRAMEEAAAAAGRSLSDMTLEEMTALWNGAKECS